MIPTEVELPDLKNRSRKRHKRAKNHKRSSSETGSGSCPNKEMDFQSKDEKDAELDDWEVVDMAQVSSLTQKNKKTFGSFMRNSIDGGKGSVKNPKLNHYRKAVLERGSHYHTTFNNKIKMD